jgi:hypothetical protein
MPGVSGRAGSVSEGVRQPHEVTVDSMQSAAGSWELLVSGWVRHYIQAWELAGKC